VQYFSVEKRRFCGAARDVSVATEMRSVAGEGHRSWLPLDTVVGPVDQELVLDVGHVGQVSAHGPPAEPSARRVAVADQCNESDQGKSRSDVVRFSARSFCQFPMESAPPAIFTVSPGMV
jgi:hypothetical protein